MKFTADCSRWIHALKPCLTLFRTTSQSDPSDHVLNLDVTAHLLTLSATSPTLHLQQTLDATIHRPGSVCLPFLPFYEFLKALDAPTFSLTTTKTHGTITTDASRACTLTLNTINDTDVPPVPRPSTPPDIVMTLSGQTCATAITTMLPYVNDHHSHRTLQHFLWHLMPSPSPQLTIVATDGHRLAKYDHLPETCQATHDTPTELLVSKHAMLVLLEVAKTLPPAEAWIVASRPQQMTISLGTVSLSVPVLAGPYVDYQHSLPTTSTFRLSLSAHTFYQAVRRMHALHTTPNQLLTIRPYQQGLLLSSTDHLVGQGTVIIDTEYSSLTEPIGFNTNYLLDVLQPFEQDSIVWSGMSPTSPSCFTTPTNPRLFFMIMPIQLAQTESANSTTPSKTL